MSDIKIYFAPGTCARVPMTCLEEAGADFESLVVAFRAGETRSEGFIELNPAGKVPLMLIDDQPLSENVAIIPYLHARFPEAGILPKTDNAYEHARVVADLAFCASVLHPIVTRIRIPEKFTSHEEIRSDVWKIAAADMAPYFAHIEKRLSQGDPWWYGDQWSAVDSYIGWVWFRVVGARMPVEDYPHFAAHAERLAARPAVQRVLAREEIGQGALLERGLELNFRPVDHTAAE